VKLLHWVGSDIRDAIFHEEDTHDLRMRDFPCVPRKPALRVLDRDNLLF